MSEDKKERYIALSKQTLNSTIAVTVRDDDSTLSDIERRAKRLMKEMDV